MEEQIIKFKVDYYTNFRAICKIELNHLIFNQDKDTDLLCMSGIIQGESKKDIIIKTRKWYNENLIYALKRAIEIIEKRK